MISKPPEIGNKEANLWARELLGWMQELLFEFMRVDGLWIPAQGTNQHGGHPSKNLTAGNSAYIGFSIPRETKEIKEVLVRFIPTVTGTIDWTADIYYGGNGEDESANTASLTANGLSVTDDRITEIDVTDLFSSVSKNDQVGLKFTLDAVTTTTDIHVLGLYFKYR